MTTMASHITSLTVVYTTVYSDADQRKHQSSASLAFVWGIPRTKGPVTRKMFSFDDVIMTWSGDRIDFTATLGLQRPPPPPPPPPMISKLSRGQSWIRLLLVTSSQCDYNSVSWFVTWNINKILFCCFLVYLYKQFNWIHLIHINEHRCAKVMALSFKCEYFQTLTFSNFLKIWVCQKEVLESFMLNFIEIDHRVEHPLIAEPRDLLIFRFQVRTYDVSD